MSTVNLRTLYPDFYTSDCFVDISDEIAEVYLKDKRWDAARTRQMYRYKAQYSLDCNDGIENAIITFPETPDEAYLQKELQETIKAALSKLPEKQRSRVVAFYFEGLKKVDIAKRDSKDSSCVCETISRGLGNLRKLLGGQL